MELYSYEIQCGDWLVDDDTEIVLSLNKYGDSEFEQICREVIEKHKKIDSAKSFTEILSNEYGFIVPQNSGSFYLKHFTKSALIENDEQKKSELEEERIRRLPRSFEFIDEISFCKKVYKEYGNTPVLKKLDYFADHTPPEYNGHQYLKQLTEYCIGDRVASSKKIAKEVFGAFEVYPIFDAYRDGELEKVSITSSIGYLSFDIKGYLIEKIIE